MSVKIYKMDEYSWYATDWDFDKTLDWYQNNITELEDSEIDEIEECDIDKEGMWWNTTNPKDLKQLDLNDELSASSKNITFGDLMRSGDEVFKYISFRKAIELSGKFTEPFEIANTEW